VSARAARVPLRTRLRNAWQTLRIWFRPPRRLRFTRAGILLTAAIIFCRVGAELWLMLKL